MTGEKILSIMEKKTKEENNVQLTTLGIIGGADGPTAIFVTGVPSLSEILCMALVAAAIIGGVVFFVRKHRKKK